MRTLPLPVLLPVLGILWAPGCQTPAPPATPATSTALAGPPPRPTVLQRAHGGEPLFPAKEGGGGHEHHHHHVPPAATPGSPP